MCNINCVFFQRSMLPFHSLAEIFTNHRLRPFHFSNHFIAKELASALQSPPEHCQIELPEESNLNEWKVTITGPESTAYAGGKFVLSFVFPAEYPFKPPSILVKTRIYHPNIKTDTGEMCAAILYDDWGPTLNVTHCLDTIINMLKCPNPDSPLEEEIAKCLREKPKEFAKKARQWTKDYAM